ncbi:MAG: CoA transferase [bacterium]|nr:CoA transferase [Gammaproteobacteria bacterium]
MAGALSHFRICDFTGQLAGAGATKWLAAFGAEVIRIEDPVRQGRWDILRGIGPFADDRRGIDLGGAFNNHNTDKKGITLNLRTDKGKEILTEIIKKSDAVTENFAAGVLEKWGFGYEDLKTIKPDIIYVSNCGFGHEGPYSKFKTWGPIVQAVSGLTFSSTLPQQPPAGWGYSYMDHTGGYYMAMAIMLALLERDKSGKGQWVDLACTEAGLSLNGPALLDWTVNQQPMRQEAGFNSNRSQYAVMAPHGIYPCQGDDEWIAISCRNDHDWMQLSALIDADLADTVKQWCSSFDALQYRLDQQDELDEHMMNWTREREKFNLQERLRHCEIPVAAVQKPAERIDQDPTTGNFGLWPTVTHSQIGEVRVDGLPVHFSETDWHMARGAPCLGEHTEEVLVDLLGKTTDEVTRLREEGVI